MSKYKLKYNKYYLLTLIIVRACLTGDDRPGDDFISHTHSTLCFLMYLMK